MQLNQLKSDNKKSKKIGRGIGSGTGKTSGKNIRAKNQDLEFL